MGDCSSGSEKRGLRGDCSSGSEKQGLRGDLLFGKREAGAAWKGQQGEGARAALREDQVTGTFCS